MYKMTADDIQNVNPEIAIIPVGSLEQHGPHLPVMTDWAVASELGKRIAEKMNAFLIPALPISTCREHMGKKGSVWMEPATFYQMMTDIVLSLKAQGFHKVGIVQCHGGIFIMNPIVRDLNAKYQPDLMVALAVCGNHAEEARQLGLRETTGELHAGEGETSLMLALAPESVHMDRAVDFVPDSIPRPWLNYGSIFRASPTGVWGEPSKASAAKGEKMLSFMTERLTRDLYDAFDYMSGKEPIGYSHF